MAKPASPTPEALLKAKTEADLVEVPARSVLAIEGAGPPEDPAFAAAIGALYGIAYTLKFARKKAGLGDDKVGVLEGEWWSEGLSREAWHVEIYLSDPNRTAPEKLKTVLLVPVPM